MIFHGGCHGCAQSKLGGTSICTRCQYFRCNWDLPDLNDQHQREEYEMEMVRRRIERGYSGIETAERYQDEPLKHLDYQNADYTEVRDYKKLKPKFNWKNISNSNLKRVVYWFAFLAGIGILARLGGF